MVFDGENKNKLINGDVLAISGEDFILNKELYPDITCRFAWNGDIYGIF